MTVHRQVIAWGGRELEVLCKERREYSGSALYDDRLLARASTIPSGSINMIKTETVFGCKFVVINRVLCDARVKSDISQ